MADGAYIWKIEAEAQILYTEHGHSAQSWQDVRDKDYWRRVAHLLFVGYSEVEAVAVASGLKLEQAGWRND